MALVPFRVSGPAADQAADTRLLQVAGFTLFIKQQVQQSGALDHLRQHSTSSRAPAAHSGQQTTHTAAAAAAGPRSSMAQAAGPPPAAAPGAAAASRAPAPAVAAAGAGSGSSSSSSGQERLPDLSRVGLVVWESSWLLAEYLLRAQPLGCWAGVQVLELGAGTGVTGMFLARAGAQVVLSDQEHILPLLQANVDDNFHQPDNNTTGTPTAAAAAAAATTTTSTACSHSAAAAGLGVPLVACYCWGCPARELLHQITVAAAAGAAGGLRSTGMAAQAEAAAEAAVQGGAAASGQEARTGTEAQPPGQPSHAAAALEAGPAHAPSAPTSPALGRGWNVTPAADAAFDVIVGADLLYDPAGHTPLLNSLQQLAAPHTQVFLCHRLRGLGEEGFLEAAAAQGWLVQVAPDELLHSEYRCGSYQLVGLWKLPP